MSVAAFSETLQSTSVSSHQIFDLGEGAIIPGLVNSHTHLEFSDLQAPLGQPGIKFTDWIRLIVSQRNATNQSTDGDGLATRKRSAIKQGMEQSIESGVWAIGEIATLPFQLNDYLGLETNMSLVYFLEQLGRDASLLDQKRSELGSFFAQQTSTAESSMCFAASPHAPYSVSPSLFSQICRQAKSAGRPVAMHLAETLAERELLDQQTGDFVKLLADFGAWDPAKHPHLLSISETLAVLSQARTSLIVHGNYLTDGELDFIASKSDRMSIAFCPRTHHFFGHSEYPLEPILKRKINVCLGTDSRASNPDLDCWKEAKHVACSFPNIDSASILKMATLNGAIALGISHSHGSISVGKKPALSFVSHPTASGNSPFDWMFDAKSTCVPIGSNDLQ